VTAISESDRGGRRFATDEELVGTELGNYRLLGLIGRGGMGRVYEAEHVRLGRKVAIKLLRPERAARREAVARFFQEAKAVNRIRHHNIVDITDFVELEDGTTFIVMELLTGRSLRQCYKDAPEGLPRDFIICVMSQVCEALLAAHAVGVVHRDLKPGNIMVEEETDGAVQVKLLDFGVAKLSLEDGQIDDFAVRTAAGLVLGTPAYMSPEQAVGGAIDGRSDVYSLGAIMYELVCRQRVFEGDTFSDFISMHAKAEPIAPSETTGGADIDPKLEMIIMRCLAKDPDDRYPTVAELHNDLFDCRTVEDRWVETVGSGRYMSVGAGPAGSSWSRALWPVAGGAALVLLSWLGYTIMPGDGGGASALTETAEVNSAVASTLTDELAAATEPAADDESAVEVNSTAEVGVDGREGRASASRTAGAALVPEIARMPAGRAELEREPAINTSVGDGDDGNDERGASAAQVPLVRSERRQRAGWQGIDQAARDRGRKENPVEGRRDARAEIGPRAPRGDSKDRRLRKDRREQQQRAPEQAQSSNRDKPPRIIAPAATFDPFQE
jgi:tRNA A-37 threonylcarbamoyl transferase component Bud32